MNLQEQTDIKSISFIVELLKKCLEDPNMAKSISSYIDEYLENCVSLQMKRSKKLDQLIPALITMQGELPLAGKESQSNYGKYADLRSVVESSRPILVKNGLCVFHTFDYETDGLYLTATLAHTSAQYMNSRVKIAPPRNDIHAIGSYITYMKRYTYAAITGIIVGDVDDDGEAAMDRTNGNGKNKVLPEECILTPEQIGTIRNLIGSRPEIADRITKKYGVTTLLQIKQKHFDDIIKGLQQINQINQNHGATNVK